MEPHRGLAGHEVRLRVLRLQLDGRQRVVHRLLEQRLGFRSLRQPGLHQVHARSPRLVAVYRTVARRPLRGGATAARARRHHGHG